MIRGLFNKIGDYAGSEPLLGTTLRQLSNVRDRMAFYATNSLSGIQLTDLLGPETCQMRTVG